MDNDYQLSSVQPLINFMKNKRNDSLDFKKDTKNLGWILLYCSLLSEFKRGSIKENLTELKIYYSAEWVQFL